MPQDASREWAQRVSVTYYAFILKVAAHVAPCPDLIPDIAHQAILDFITHHDRWDTESDPRPILAKITRNIAATQRRQWDWARPEVVRKISEIILQRANTAVEDDWRDEQRDRLDLCMKRLSPEARSLLEMHYTNELSHEEIATSTRRTIRAVYQALFRIREVLRECVKRPNPDQAAGQNRKP